jgi:hypothetical protein
VSDIDTAVVVDGLKALDPKWPIREAYIAGKPTMIDREIAIAEVFLVRLSPPPRPDASRNKLAVAAAYDALNWRSQSDHAERQVIRVPTACLAQSGC